MSTAHNDLAFARAAEAWITPPAESPVACAHCAAQVRDVDAIEATSAHVSAAMADTLVEGDLLCGTCAADLAHDAATYRAEEERELAGCALFATVCDVARDAWIAEMEALAEADLPDLPGSLAWTEERGLCAAVSL